MVDSLARPVCNTIFILLHILFISCSSHNTEETEKSREINTKELAGENFTFDCGYNRKLGNGCELGDWILDSVYFDRKQGNKPIWAFFYFKVTGAGKVDSLFYSGTVSSEIANKIKDNIYKTEGHWKISSDFPSEGYQWFVLPYFNLGDLPCISSLCTKEDSIFQWSIRMLVENIDKTQGILSEHRARIFPPVTIDSRFPKM